MLELHPSVVLSGFHYIKKELLIAFKNHTEDLPRQEVRDAVLRAIETWNREINIEFNHAPSIKHSNVFFEWMDRTHKNYLNHEFDGPGGNYASMQKVPETSIRATNGMLRSGNRFMVFDEEDTWDTSGRSIPDIETITLHEFGHFLGLGHFTSRRSIMFEFNDRIKRDLHQIDKHAIKFLYPTFERCSDGFSTNLKNFKKHVVDARAVGGFVTAVRDAEDNLRLQVMKMGRNEKGLAIGHQISSGAVAGKIRDMDLSATVQTVLTASINSSRNLILHTWNAPFLPNRSRDINIQDTYRYPKVTFWTGVKVINITANLFVVGTRTRQGRLKLILFEISRDGQIRHRYEFGDNSDYIYKMNLTKANKDIDNHLLSIVTRRADGKVRMLMVKVTNDGRMSLAGKSRLISVKANGYMDTTRDAHGRLITAYITRPNKLQFISWSLNVGEDRVEIPAPQVTTEEEDFASELKLSSTPEGLICAIKDARRTFRLINFRTDINGNIKRRGDSEGLIGFGGRKYHVHADPDRTDNIMCSMSDGNSNLKYIQLKYVVRE